MSRINRYIANIAVMLLFCAVPVLAEGETTGEQTLGGNTTVAFTNTLEGNVPTGISMDIIPFAVIAVAAAVITIMIVKKEK